LIQRRTRPWRSRPLGLGQNRIVCSLRGSASLSSLPPILEDEDEEESLISPSISSLNLIPPILQSVSAAATQSCSQQAMNEEAGGQRDDVTIDELASYIEYGLVIPKKMSTMAEMMYT